jgi:hypothetical protein
VPIEPVEPRMERPRGPSGEEEEEVMNDVGSRDNQWKRSPPETRPDRASYEQLPT